jgi:pentatricopeptide repeat protein
MDAVNLKPNGRTYGLLATLLARTNKVDKAMKVLEQAVTDGHQPPAESFKAVVRCALIQHDIGADALRELTAEALRLAKLSGAAIGKDFEFGYVNRRLRGLDAS